jgi:rhomboid protease GluP
MESKKNAATPHLHPTTPVFAHPEEWGVSLPDGFDAIGPTASLQRAQEWLFVIRAVQLDGFVRKTTHGMWVLCVPIAMVEKARKHIHDFEQENREAEVKKRHEKDKPLYTNTSWAIIVCSVMLAFFIATGPIVKQSVWFRYGVANAQQIFHGAPYQAVTALTLHADSQHVLGNFLAGTLFLTTVHRRMGAGVGTFVVLASGIAGNTLNAWWHLASGHHSLGASTAVMGAVGVLAATQMVLNRHKDKSFFATWGPIMAGLALLGTFGASANSDLYAHGFGFLAGLGLGTVAALPFRQRKVPMSRWIQIGFGVASALVVAGSWAAAFYYHRVS